MDNSVIKTIEKNEFYHCVRYELVGTNMQFTRHIDDNFGNTVEVSDLEAYLSGEDDYMQVLDESRFFEESGGFDMGTENLSVEDLIKIEFKFLIDIDRSDRAAQKGELKNMKPVSFADIAYTNFN